MFWVKLGVDGRYVKVFELIYIASDGYVMVWAGVLCVCKSV